MSADGRILVVGTTPDYIDWLAGHYPGRAVFVTESSLRKSSEFPAPAADSEVLFSQPDVETVARLLDAHSRRYSQHWSGITCFDCESLELAAELAEMFKLPFAPKHAVVSCRNKRSTRCRWDSDGVRTPQSSLVSDVDSLMRFFATIAGPVVIKPLTASGSELVFVCRTDDDCRRNFNTLMTQMHTRGANRLFENRSAAVAEEFVEGPEYSCDFYISDGKAKILRIAKKYLYDGQWPGIIKAYEIPGTLPAGMNMASLAESLERAADSLGIANTIIMTDFIVNRNEACFLEMTPRPGGDCLPQMYRNSGGRDMLGLAVEYAANGKLPAIDPQNGMRRVAGLRLFAHRGGVLQDIAFDKLAGLPILETCTIGPVGRRIVMPPDDYDSWKLGNVIFAPCDSLPVEKQCDEILARLNRGVWIK